MIFQISPPANRYDLTQIILGESTTETGDMVPVASSVAIGTFPEYIKTYTYASSVDANYYSYQWKYSNGGYSDWSSPRVLGRTGVNTSYIIVNAPTASSIYIMTPVSGDAISTTSWLEYNKEYYITIKNTLQGELTLPMVSDYTFTFTSTFCPLFTTVNEIRYEAGDFINNLTDDTINRIIHKNSLYIINRYYNMLRGLPAGYTCDGNSINSAFKRYVMCKSALDAITAIQLSKGGQTTKKLADVMFQYSNIDSRKDPNNKKAELKDCADVSLNIIFNSNTFQIGIKGKYFLPFRHPMSDPKYSRLAITNKGYQHNMDSIFDESLEVGIYKGSGQI